jgi:hypothetical protein
MKVPLHASCVQIVAPSTVSGSPLADVLFTPGMGLLLSGGSAVTAGAPVIWRRPPKPVANNDLVWLCPDADTILEIRMTKPACVRSIPTDLLVYLRQKCRSRGVPLGLAPDTPQSHFCSIGTRSRPRDWPAS